MGYEHHIVLLLLALQIGSTHNQIRDKVANFFRALQLKHFSELIKYQEQVNRVGNSEIQFIFNEKLLQNLFFCKQHVQQDQIQPFMVNIESETYQFLQLYQGKPMEIYDLARVELMIQLQTQINSNNYQLSDSNCVKVLKFINSEENQQLKQQQMRDFSENLNQIAVSFESLCKISNFQALPSLRSIIMQLINQKLHIFQSFKVLFLYFVALILTKQQQQFLTSFNDLIEVGALRFQQFMLLPVFRCFEYLMEPEESDIQGFLYPSFILPDLYRNVTISDTGFAFREKLRKLEAEFKIVNDGDVYDLIIKEFQSNSTSVYKFPLVYYQFQQFMFQTKLPLTKKFVVTTLKQFRNFYQNCYFEKQDRKLQFIPHFKYIQLIERFDITIQNVLDTTLINQVFPNYKIEFSDQFNMSLFSDLIDSPMQELPTIIQHDQKYKGIEDFSILELLKMGLHYNRQSLTKITEYDQFSFYDLQINDFLQSNSQHLPFIILGECLLKFDQRKLQQYFQSISVDIRIYQLYEYFQDGIIMPEYLSFGNELQLQLKQSKQKYEIKQTPQTLMIDQLLSGSVVVNEYNADNLVMELLTSLVQDQNQCFIKQDEIKLCLKNLKQFANQMKHISLLRLKMCYIFNCKSLNCDDPLDIAMLAHVINCYSPKHPSYSVLMQVFDQLIKNDIQNLVLIMSFQSLFKIPNKFLFDYIITLFEDHKQLFKLQNQENVLLKYLVSYISIFLNQQCDATEDILLLLLQTYHKSISFNQKETVYSVLQNQIMFEKMQLVAELLSIDKDYCNLCFAILRNQYDLNNLLTLDTIFQQEIIQFCCGLNMSKVQVIPASIITYSVQSQQYSDELLDFVIQNQLVDHLPKHICKMKIPFLVVDEQFNNDLNFRFQKSIQQTTDNNDFRLALMGIHQVNPNSAISWRLNIKNIYVISNIFDDFMCNPTETQFTLLISLLLRNIQQKEYFSMTMCMLLAALLIRDSSNFTKLQDIVIAFNKYLPYFEYELIDSAINIINKQDTSLQRLQNQQQVSALEEEMLGQMDTIIIFSEYQLKQYDKQDIKSIHNNQSEVVRMLPNEYMDQDSKINKLKQQFQQAVTQKSYRLKDIFVKLLTIVDNNFIFGEVLDQKILIDFSQQCYVLLKNILLYLLLTLDNALVIEKFIKMQFINQIILHYSTDKEFLTILNYISAHNGTISCATIEKPLQQQLFNQQFYLQTLMEMMKVQQTFPIVAEVVLQHPIHDVKISQVTIQNVAQSANLVIFVQLFTDCGTICEVVKIGHENFSQSYAFELLTDVMNENLQYELGPASGSTIRKLHSVPFMTLSMKDRDQLNLTRSVQEVITRYQKQLPKEIEVGISPFERLTPLISVFDQFQEFKDVMPQLKQLYQNQHNKQQYQGQQKLLIDHFPKNLLHQYIEKQRILYKDISYRRFLESFILNSIITLIFGYGDRHLDNIVISDEQLMNIDPEKLYFFSLLQGTPEVVRFRYTGNFQQVFPPAYFQHSVERIQQQLFSNNRNVIEFVLKNQVQNDILRHFILMKLDLTEAQWAREVQDATDSQLLCKMFCGWMPFV